MECPLKDRGAECKECSTVMCMWWDDGSKVCAVKGIYDSLYTLNAGFERDRAPVQEEPKVD